MEERKRPLFTFEDDEEQTPADATKPQAAAQTTEKQPQPMVLVDIDIPLSSMALFCLKLLAVVLPTLAALGAGWYFLWKVVELGSWGPS